MSESNYSEGFPQELKSYTASRELTAPRQERAGDKLPGDHGTFEEIFWEKLIEQSTVSPSGIEAPFWPIRVMNEYVDKIVHRSLTTDRKEAAFAAQIAPLNDTLRRVKTAYEITAYKHCKNPGYQLVIEGDIKSDSRLYERDSVVLSEAEMGILQRFCETPRYALRPKGIKTLEPKIPFDPKQKVYHHKDVIPNLHRPQTPLISGK